MIEVSSLAAVFMVEGLAGAVLFIVGITVYILRRRAMERNAAGRFISQIKKSEAGRSERLALAISQSCTLDQAQLNTLLSAVNTCEKSLYKKIIQMFLNRDIVLLNGIEQSIQALTTPFCRLLTEVSGKTRIDPEQAEALASARAEIERLKKDRERISNQLTIAMESMDEISSEYTKLFASSKEAEELDMSRKRMLNTYIRAEQRITKAFGEG